MNKKGISKIQAAILGVIIIVAVAVPIGYWVLNSGSPVEEIRIGASYCLSGALAEYGQEQLRGAQMAVTEINAGGGVYVSEYGKKLPLKLIIYDDTTNVDTVKTNVEKLLSQDKVHVLLGPPEGAALPAIMELPERDHIPMFCVADQIPRLVWDVLESRNYNYTIQSFPGLAPVTGAEVVKMVEAYRDELNISKVAIAYLDYEWTIGMAEVAKEKVQADGFDLVMYEVYPFEMTDFGPLATKIKQTQADAVIVDSFMPDAVMLTNALHEVGFAPKILYFAEGPNFPGPWKDAVGDLAKGVSGLTPWSDTLPFAGVDEFYQKYNATYGEYPAYSAWNYGAVQVATQAIEKAGSLNGEKIIAAAYDGEYSTITGTYTFGKGGRTTNLYSLVLQYDSNLDIALVWPNEWATGNLTSLIEARAG